MHGALRILSNFSMQRWAMEALFLLELHGQGYEWDEAVVATQASHIGYAWDNLGMDFCMVLVLGLGWRVAAWACLYLLNQDKMR